MVYRNAGSISLLIQAGIGLVAAVIVALEPRTQAVRRILRSFVPSLSESWLKRNPTK